MMKDKYFSDICKTKQSINKNKKILNNVKRVSSFFLSMHPFMENIFLVKFTNPVPRFT